MRCHCPVPFIERETTENFVIDGISLPKGTVIDIQIYNLHHNPAIWDEPMVRTRKRSEQYFLHA